MDIKGLTERKKEEILSKLKKSTFTKTDLKKPEIFKLLSKETQAYLTYNPKPIKRHEVPPFFKSLGTITGSYRRECKIINDVDIVLTPGCTIDTALFKTGIKFKYFVYSKGAEKASFIVINKNKKNFKVDIWTSTLKNWAFMLFYTTGSKQYNIIMRHYAKSRGFLLNRHGLYKNHKFFGAKTEREIYVLLKQRYKPPHLRTYGATRK